MKNQCKRKENKWRKEKSNTYTNILGSKFFPNFTSNCSLLIIITFFAEHCCFLLTSGKIHKIYRFFKRIRLEMKMCSEFEANDYEIGSKTVCMSKCSIFSAFPFNCNQIKTNSYFCIQYHLFYAVVCTFAKRKKIIVKQSGFWNKNGIIKWHMYAMLSFRADKNIGMVIFRQNYMLRTTMTGAINFCIFFLEFHGISYRQFDP